MSKVRITNGTIVKYVTERVAANKNLLQTRGFYVEEIETPAEAPVVKEEVKNVEEVIVAEPIIEEPVKVEWEDLEGKELKDFYKEKLNKKPHHSWSDETIKEKLSA